MLLDTHVFLWLQTEPSDSASPAAWSRISATSVAGTSSPNYGRAMHESRSRPAVLLTLIAVVAACAAPAAAQAAQRYADPGGSGTACTQGSPCSLDTAVEDSSVADGDEVIVMPGTYSTADVLVTDAISLHGEAGQPRPTINVSSGNGLRVSDVATVSDLKIAGTSVGIYADLGSAGSTFERLEVSASSSFAIACSAVDGVTIRDSVCWAAGATA